MRILGIDYGDARTGLALSDISGSLASGAGVIHEKDVSRLTDKIAAKAKENEAGLIILGHPVNMDGTLGARAEKTAVFADMLREACALEVVLWDERRTTADAERLLLAAGRRGKRRREVVDEVAAVLILQGYLDGLRMRRGAGGVL